MENPCDLIVLGNGLWTRATFQNLNRIIVQVNNLFEGIPVSPPVRKRVQLSCTLGEADAELPSEKTAISNSSVVI